MIGRKRLRQRVIEESSECTIIDMTDKKQVSMVVSPTQIDSEQSPTLSDI